MQRLTAQVRWRVQKASNILCTLSCDSTCISEGVKRKKCISRLVAGELRAPASPTPRARLLDRTSTLGGHLQAAYPKAVVRLRTTRRREPLLQGFVRGRDRARASVFAFV